MRFVSWAAVRGKARRAARQCRRPYDSRKRRNLLRGRRCRHFFARRFQHVEVDELVASRNGGARRLPVRRNRIPLRLVRGLLPRASRNHCGSRQRKNGRSGLIEQVHGIDDHRTAGSFLGRGIGKLLNRLERMLQQAFLPAIEIGSDPIAIDTLDARRAVVGDFSEQAGNDPRRGVSPSIRSASVEMVSFAISRFLTRSRKLQRPV